MRCTGRSTQACVPLPLLGQVGGDDWDQHADSRSFRPQNIPAARLLLQRDDTDTRLKDREGLTPFDVYNSTVDGTNPLSSSPLSTHPLNPGRIELLSWGSNRNYTLGFATDSERHTPERVALRREEGASGLAAFEPLRVKDVNMARLHTAIVTDEKSNNIRLCGYGTGGRCVPSLSSFLPPPGSSAELTVALACSQPRPDQPDAVHVLAAA